MTSHLECSPRSLCGGRSSLNSRDMSSFVLNRLLRFDTRIKQQFQGCLAGVDEVGRGPLAGPVVAAAVILFRKSSFKGLNDSKQVLPERRELLFWEIAQNALVGLGVVDEQTIDEINIYHASLLAMKRAVLALTRTPDLLLVDGKAKVSLPIMQQTVIGGDGKSASIAAASIIAKVYRDAWMKHLDQLYPDYNFKSHKGYATPEHIKRIRQIGPSPVHRKSFYPVQTFFEEPRESVCEVSA